MLRKKGSTILNIHRTSTNRSRCTFPGCECRIGLHDVCRKIRFKVMKQRNIYIPDKARACNLHLVEDLWNTVGDNDGQRSAFSTKQIEDMVQLLCRAGPKIESDMPC